MSQMTPREIVHELNRHIIGQDDAKRAVAIALRNRWRRSQLDDEMRNEVTPKNILMIGPTGVGQIAEIVCQLRGEAGDRQQPEARVGMAHMVGIGAVCVVHVLRCE